VRQEFGNAIVQDISLTVGRQLPSVVWAASRWSITAGFDLADWAV